MPPASLATGLRLQLLDLGLEPPATLALERPRKPEHGDWSVNCFPLAKGSSMAGPQLAQELADRLNADLPAHVAKVEVVGGFLNFRLHPSWLHDVLRQVVGEGPDAYARHAVGAGHTVNVEFVSANPTGPLHAGHGRWAAYGDSLGRLLERCGWLVHREFYVNDRGVQLQHFGASLAAAKAGLPIPEDGYKGAYIEEWAAEMPDGVDPVRWGEQRALADHRETLARMGVRYDTWTSERSLVDAGAMDVALADLRARGHVYEADGAVWLRTSEHGDDRDPRAVKADGDPTYFLPDIAYHRDKFARGWEHLINVLGADHHGYVRRMKAAVEMLGHDRDDLEIVIGQNVVLLRGGQEVKLSKRAGNIIELGADVIDEVGPDATRFTYLLTSIDTKLTFDIDLVVSQSLDNPVYYVQMAHARLCGIARTAASKGVERLPLSDVDLGVLTHPRELELLTRLSELPAVVLEACERRAPNKVAQWARDDVAAIHGFHHDCWVVAPSVPPELTQARLWVVESARIGLAVALDLLGVSAPEQL